MRRVSPAKEMDFLYLELLLIKGYPLGSSWGYHMIGYFAPASRLGTLGDFAYFMDALHREGIWVILDWVEFHFAAKMHKVAGFDGSNPYEHADFARSVEDAALLYEFDGSNPYEHTDSKQRFHPK